ncbi:AMP-binding protein [Paraburkholderia sp. BL10I2N1]|uniref:AMP-binding protein n=1 Tax=Paraburkholderia sp. BL10I2N1 TaxID=1938796 RepID=UPI00105D4F4B|nr:AMP-binding protein [Paraburkholderia sp. BL10I2N1]TDN61403.1 acetyl-CoA synthetase [Paraburkholderia sp. BL10I2N1]
MTDILAELTSTPLTDLRPEWRVESQQRLLTEARAIESQGSDRYWGWVADRMRWSRSWDVIRKGGFDSLRYYVGGTLNVADNCVDRYAEDPVSSTRDAVIWEGEDGAVRRLSYLDLRDQVVRFASALRGLGVRRGDVVAIHLPNVPEAFVAIHACNRIGAIYTVLFSGFSSEAISLRLQASRAAVVVTADAALRRGRKVPLLQNMRAGRAASVHVRHTVVVNRTGDPLSLEQNEIEWNGLLERQDSHCPCEPMEANDPAFLIFTSGTESRPKGVVHSVAGFLVGTWANVQWQVGPQPDDVYWCAADVGWLTFPIQAVIGGLAHGLTLVCYEGALDFPDKTRMLDIAKRHGVTKLLVAPTGLRMLRAAGEAAIRDSLPPDLRLVTTQGETLDTATAEWTCRTLDVPVVNAYGQTETGSTWTMPVYGVDPIKHGSCGRPVPGHCFAVVDDGGKPVGAGVRGNLVLTEPFPTLARTIWDDPGRYVESYFKRFPGSYATSDEAVVDNDGQIWVLGRADDVINVAAHRISTMEIESAVASCEGVVEAAVVGVNDALRGTLPVAFVTLKQGVDSSDALAAVSAAAERAVGTFARLGSVYVVTALPKTRAGKIMRRLLREAVETGAIEGDLTGLEDPASLDVVLEAVRKDAKR